MSSYQIPEQVVPGRRLGRHVNHDPRSLRFLVGAPARALQSVEHRRTTPVLDQGELGSCHDGDTEILTRRGWLPFPDLTLENEVATVDPATQELTYEKPVRVIRLPYCGPMYTVQNRRQDFRVTPDHSMLVRTWDERARALSQTYSFVLMKEIGSSAGLMPAATFLGTAHDGTYRIPGVPGYQRASQREDALVPIKAWLGFLGVYLAGRTMIRPTTRSPHKIQIAASKGQGKGFVRGVLAELGVGASEQADRFTFEDARIYRHLEDLGLKGVYPAEKFVPEFVFDLPGDDMEALLEGHREGDGSGQNRCWTHRTPSPRLADDLQRLIFLAGGQTGLSTRSPRSSVTRDDRGVSGRRHEYEVRRLFGGGSSIQRNSDVRIEHYEGMVYCAEVPTHHTLVTRRNGKILISGNCTGNAAVGALGTEPLVDALPAKHPALDEDLAVQIYSSATEIDPYDGQYPPDDTGSDGLSVAKVAKSLGLISGFLTATSVPAMQQAVQNTPVIVGVKWYEGFDSPDDNGVVKISGDVRGGHEFEILGVDMDNQLFHAVNSWGTGWGKDGHFWFSFDTMGQLLDDDGDCTQFLPLTVPPPIPAPVPADTAFPGVTPEVDARIQTAARRSRMNLTDWQNHHYARYFRIG